MASETVTLTMEMSPRLRLVSEAIYDVAQWIATQDVGAYERALRSLRAACYPVSPSAATLAVWEEIE